MLWLAIYSYLLACTIVEIFWPLFLHVGMHFQFSLYLQAVALANIAYLLNGGFFYIDTSNRINFGACFSRGDLFSLCLNGMAVSVASVIVASIFILKDCVMCAVNSISVSGLHWSCSELLITYIV